MHALAPIFATILFGFFLRLAGFPSPSFCRESELATYYIFFPCLLFSSIATAEFNASMALPVAGAVTTSILVLSALLLAGRRLLPMAPSTFSSLFQGAIRPNTYVGLAGATAYYGDYGLTLAAVVILTMIPLVNLLAVPVVSYFGDRGNLADDKRLGIRRALINIAKNPLILASLAGFAAHPFQSALPGAAIDFLNILGRAALPLGLLAVGAGLNFSAFRQGFRLLSLSVLLKLLLLPLLMLVACVLYDLGREFTVICVLFTALPCSASSFVLARQLGGDESAMAAIITVQTALAALTLPLMMQLAGAP